MTGFNAKYSNYRGFHNGLLVDNAPVSPGFGGKVFWVGNNATLLVGESGASDSNDGSFLKPFSTLDYAIGRCAANRGDIIYVRPNHTTTASAADAVDVDVAGVSIIGLGNGSNRPRIDYTAAAGELVIGADNVLVQNFNLHANVTDVLKAIDIEASVDDTTIRRCFFDVEATATDEFANSIILATNNKRTTIIDNEFDMGLGGAVNAIYMDNSAAADEATKIIGNIIMGDYSTACIASDTTASNDILIHDNLLVNGESDNLNTEPCIELLTLSSGVISENRLVCNVATPDVSVVADACILTGNTYSETVAGAEAPLYTPQVPDSTYNFIGVDDSDNAASTSNVAANENGSILERLEQIQEAVNIGSGTSMGANKSIADALGTNGVTLVDDAVSVVGILGVNDANNAFSSSSVVADRDGSLLERSEFAINGMQKGFSVAAIDLSAVSPRTAYTIAGGPIFIWFLGIKITATCSANAALVNFNSTPTVGSATPISKVATAPDLQNAVAGDWFAVAGGSTVVAVKYATGTSLPVLLSGTAGGMIVDAGTIEVVMSTNDLTTGTATAYMVYTPMADGVTVS